MNEKTTRYFCLDIGGTGTRGALFNANGEQLARAESTGGALSLGVTVCFAAIETVWKRICQQIELSENNRAGVKITAGIAGHGLPGRSRELEALLCNFAQVQITGDGYGALLAATKGKPGALISVGTGVGALKLTQDNKTQAVSSWGFPAGDAGSGAWIGLRVFGDMLKALDGIVLDPALNLDIINQILAVTGSSPQHIMAWQMSAQPKDFAQFTPFVAANADKNDAYAKRLLDEAAGKIVRVAVALKTPENHCIHLSGGLGSILLPYCQSIGPTINWCLSKADPIEGIFLLATGQAPEQVLLPRPGLIT